VENKHLKDVKAEVCVRQGQAIFVAEEAFYCFHAWQNVQTVTLGSWLAADGRNVREVTARCIGWANVWAEWGVSTVSLASKLFRHPELRGAVFQQVFIYRDCCNNNNNDVTHFSVLPTYKCKKCLQSGAGN